jgi:hypothetical protein
MRVVTIVVGLVLALGAGPARAGRRDWVGAAACGACHPRELAAWQATAHAQTRGRFAARPPAACLGCHGTGEAPAGPAIAVEVGCEACHGAGAGYAEDDLMRDPPLAAALGLIAPRTAAARAALCAGCHARPTRGAPFDPTAAVHAVGAFPPRTP